MEQHSHLEIDDWFQLEDYACVSSFGARDWCLSLLVRFDYRESKKEQQSANPGAFWQEYLNQTRPKNVQSLLANDDYNWVCSGFDALKEIPLDDIRSVEAISDISDLTDIPVNTETIKHIRDEMIWFGKRMLLIDLEAPDPDLRERFKEWLQKSRKASPLPVRRRGPKSVNVQITEEHFHSWTNYNVLACFDLDYWAQVFRRSPITLEELCYKINPNFGGNAKEWGVAARDKLDEALDSIPTLRFQISGDKD